MRFRSWSRDPSMLAGGVTGVAIVVLLVASLALAVRLPDSATLSIDGRVPDADALASTDPSSASTARPRPRRPPRHRHPRRRRPRHRPPGTSATNRRSPSRVGWSTPTPAVAPCPVTAAAAPAPPAPPPTTPVGPGTGDTPRARFASRFPAHDSATQDTAQPASTRWGLLVGVNKHQGRTHDNIGSRPDAESLYAHLMDLGWQPDHVLLLTDELATRENILEGVRWLARSTTPDSVAVFSYSGHAKQWPGWDVDGDGETTDEALWPSDNQHITDGEFADLMGTVRAGHMWLNFMACEAAGFLDPGLSRDGRIVSVSSAEDEKSYEDPSVGHSVWGWNLTVQGLRRGAADANGDGEVTVQEAVAYAIPRATRRTEGQSHGAQHGGMVDRAGGAFHLTIPAPPPPPEPEPAAEPEPSPSPSSSPRSCLLGLCDRRD